MRARIDVPWSPQYWCLAGARLIDPVLVVMHCGSVGADLDRYLRDPRATPGDPGARLCADGIWRRAVSSHLAWRPGPRGTGGALVQGVSLDMQAWHAGGARWRGRGAVNARSIGIELAGPPSRARGDVELDELRRVARLLVGAVPSLRWWCRHSDIDRSKRDPGPGLPEDWARGMLAYDPGL